MRSYRTPNVELVKLTVADVIALSADDNLAENDDVETAPIGWFD